MIIVERSHHRVGDAFVMEDWLELGRWMKEREAEYESGESYQIYDDGPIFRKEVWTSVTLGITWYCRQVEYRKD